MKKCLHCGEMFRPATSKPKTCGWRCRFLLLQSSFEPGDECWKWPQSLNPQTGYGQFHTEGEEKRNQSAHRLSYILNKGQIHDGLLILHSCDNRWCFNPRHLSMGTNAENTADMIERGRQNNVFRHRLEDHANSKLTIAAVQEIRQGKDSTKILAEKFGVSLTTIYYAKSGATWKTVPAAPQSS